MAVRRGRLAGFTIIELMIVVAVVIILSASVAMTLPRFQGDNLLVAATEVQTVIDMSRQAAITHRVPWSVTFDVLNNRVTYNDSQMVLRTVDFSSQVGFPVILGDISPARVSVYIDAQNYYSNTRQSPVLTFDGFGNPDIERLAIPAGLEALVPGYGVITLETRGAGKVIQILIYANTGRTELRWVRR